LQSQGVSTQAVCSASEHHAVLHCVEHVGGVVVGADPQGAINLDALMETLTRLHGEGVKPVVSVMAVNNEVGTITNMEEVSRIVRRYAPTAILHTDAVQGACWVDLAHLVSLVDILTLSSHKFGGPKGSGIMYLRNGVHLEPLIFGGGQERDRRSGTHNVAGIAATTAALTATAGERHNENLRVMELKEQLLAGLHNIGGVHQTVPNEVSVPGIVHVCVEGVENEALLFLLDEEHLCASAASACASGAMEPSHVLAAMDVPRERAQGALRLSLGHTTTSGDIVQALGTLGRAVARLREHQRS
jgi:cysteine desulfurase